MVPTAAAARGTSVRVPVPVLSAPSRDGRAEPSSRQLRGSSSAAPRYAKALSPINLSRISLSTGLSGTRKRILVRASNDADFDVEVEVGKSGATTFHFIDPTEALSQKAREIANEVSPLLKGVSVTIVGDNGEINSELAKLLAPLLEYAPLITADTVEQFTGQPVAETLADPEEGPAAVAAVEAAIMEQLSMSVRTVVATMGGGEGAAARGGCWRHFFGHLCVWIEEVPAPGSTEVVEDKPQNDAYEQAEVQAKVVSGGADPKELAKDALEQVLAGMKAVLQMEDDAPGLDLAGKKLLYIKLGVRGDWPDIMPPEWRPEGEE